VQSTKAEDAKTERAGGRYPMDTCSVSAGNKADNSRCSTGGGRAEHAASTCKQVYLGKRSVRCRRRRLELSVAGK
jgi:hypothetical protein